MSSQFSMSSSYPANGKTRPQLSTQYHRNKLVPTRMGKMGSQVCYLGAYLIRSQEVTVAPYDPFSHGEQVYLGNMDLELSFVKANLRTDQQFDSDELAKFFISVTSWENFVDVDIPESDICSRTETRHGLSIIPNENRREIR
jgi:hypothetical protein